MCNNYIVALCCVSTEWVVESIAAVVWKRTLRWDLEDHSGYSCFFGDEGR